MTGRKSAPALSLNETSSVLMAVSASCGRTERSHSPRGRSIDARRTAHLPPPPARSLSFPPNQGRKGVLNDLPLRSRRHGRLLRPHLLRQAPAVGALPARPQGVRCEGRAPARGTRARGALAPSSIRPRPCLRPPPPLARSHDIPWSSTAHIPPLSQPQGVSHQLSLEDGGDEELDEALQEWKRRYVHQWKFRALFVPFIFMRKARRAAGASPLRESTHGERQFSSAGDLPGPRLAALRCAAPLRLLESVSRRSIWCAVLSPSALLRWMCAHPPVDHRRRGGCYEGSLRIGSTRWFSWYAGRVPRAKVPPA